MFGSWCLACYISFPSKPCRNYTWIVWTFGYLQNYLFWSGFRFGFSNIQEFLYVCIFKVQSLSDRVHGRFSSVCDFLVVVDRLLVHVLMKWLKKLMCDTYNISPLIMKTTIIPSTKTPSFTVTHASATISSATLVVRRSSSLLPESWFPILSLDQNFSTSNTMFV